MSRISILIFSLILSFFVLISFFPSSIADSFFVAVPLCSAGTIRHEYLDALGHAPLSVSADNGSRSSTLFFSPPVDQWAHLSRRGAACAGTAAWCRTCCRCSTRQPSGRKFQRRRRWTSPLWRCLCLTEHLQEPQSDTHTLWKLLDGRICLQNTLTGFLCVQTNCLPFLEETLWMWWSRARGWRRRSSRRCYRGLMADLLLKQHAALEAAQWEQQQQEESWAARHVAHPLGKKILVIQDWVQRYGKLVSNQVIYT